MNNIDYEKVETFKVLEQKEGKLALATYAQDTFDIKLNRQKSFDNMLQDLESEVPTQAGEEVKPVELPDVPAESLPVQTEEPFDLVPAIVKPEVSENDNTETTGEVPPSQEEVNEPESDPASVPVSDSPLVSGDMSWLDGFSPTINLMGRSERSNGYYTLSWWVYDWISSNSNWYEIPDLCPDKSAIPVVKSLVYYINRDGDVTIRESRNSRFVKISF